MPQVPQYNREVGAQITPTPYRNDRVNEDTFGGSVYKAQQMMGAVIGQEGQQAVHALMHLKDKYDRTKLIEFSNELQKYEQDNIRNGYFKTYGKDAMGGSTKVMEDWSKNGENLLNKYKFTGYTQARAKDILLGYTSHIQQNVDKHDFQESERWNNTVFDDAYNNVLNNVSFNRHDPQGLARAFKNLNTLIENDQRYQKLDSDTKAIFKSNLIAKAHEQVLNSLISEGSLAAQAYYEAHKDKIPAAKQNDYISKISNMERDYTARDTAQKLITIDPAEAYKQIDNIENIDLRNATESEYNRLLKQQENAQKEIDRRISNEIMQKVYSAYDNGQDISSIMQEVNISDMSLEQKDKIYKNLKTMQELEGAGNNWADYNYLLDLAVVDNEQFLKTNIADYAVNKEQYNKLTEMQRKAAKNEYTPEKELMKYARQIFDWNHTNNSVFGQKEFELEALRYLQKIERMQGEAFDLKNDQQLKNIVAGFKYKDPNATNKNFDEVGEIFQRAKKKGKVFELMAQEYQLFKGQNKREPEPKEFYEMAVRSYNTVDNDWKRKDQGKYQSYVGLYQEVAKTTPKKGETKVLTHFADVEVPRISNELGFNLRVTSRYREGDKGGHGQGRKVDIGMNGVNEADKIRAFQKVLAHPLVVDIGVSDPILLKRFNNPKNPKIRDLTKYDNDYRKKYPNTTMNHVNHWDISLDMRYNNILPNYNMSYADKSKNTYQTPRIY